MPVVDSTKTTPGYIMYSDVRRWYKDPNLYVVGRWSNGTKITGDATGGTVKATLNYVTDATNIAFFPKQKGWFTLDNLQIATDQAAMKYGAYVYSRFGTKEEDIAAVGHFMQGTLAENIAPSFYCNNEHNYDMWLMYQYPGAIGGLVVLFETNANAKLYYVFARGLILKDINQLVEEDLARLIKER